MFNQSVPNIFRGSRKIGGSYLRRYATSFLLLALLLLTNDNCFSQTRDKSQQLSDDGLSKKQVKVRVGLIVRDSESKELVLDASVRIYEITNAKDRIKNGKVDPRYVTEIDEIGAVNVTRFQQKDSRDELGSAYFYLFYNKEYLIVISAPGYVQQQFSMRTTIPSETYSGLIQRSNYFSDKLRNYKRYVDLVPCKGNCIDTSHLQLVVSYSPDSGRFNMITNRFIVTDDDVAGELSSQSADDNSKNSTPETRTPSNATIVNSKDGMVVSPSPGASAIIFRGDTINLIDIDTNRQGIWIYFGSNIQDSAYPSESVYCEGSYLNDMREGDWTKFYPNFDTAAILSFDKNSFSGDFSFFYTSGSIEENGHWNSSQHKLNGIYREYYENGLVHKECLYDDEGLRNGIQNVYYPSGNIAITASMQKDTLEGYMNYYLNDGEIYLQQLYSHGKLISEKYYGSKNDFPLELKDALAYLLLKNDSIIDLKIRRTLLEFSQLDSSYSQLLRERDEQMRAAGLLLTSQERELWLARRNLTRSELEKEFQTSEVQRQRIIILASVVALALSFLLFFIVFRNNRKRKKAYRLLQLQKEEIHKQKGVIEGKNKDITDSIQCASRIQQALLTSKNYLDRHLTDYFVFFRPRDIVSGDFYWAQNQKGVFYLAVCDSTGHGVPGAFMSLLNLSFLNQAVVEKNIISPNLILEDVRTKVVESLNPEGALENSREGMDAALMAFDFENRKLMVACANNPVWIIRHSSSEKELIEIRPDKQSIGYSEKPSSFKVHSFDLQKGDLIYSFSDGYADQFGGPDGKKFKSSKFRKLLMDMPDVSMLSQSEIIRSTFDEWKGTSDQVDDVCVLGVRIS